MNATLAGVTALAAGGSTTFALEGGQAYSFGYGADLGYTGANTGGDQFTPAAIPGLTNVAGIAAGLYTAGAVLSNGSLVEWGGNSHGEIGSGTCCVGAVSPQPTVPPTTGVSKLTMGSYTAAIIKTDGTVWTWGANASGQLGNGPIVSGNPGNDGYAPTKIPSGITNPILLACGYNHMLAALAVRPT